MDVNKIKEMSLNDWLDLGDFSCACGKVHTPGSGRVIVESGAIRKLPELLKEAGITKPFLLSGKNTFKAAGDKVCAALEEAGIPYGKFIYDVDHVLPTEHSVGSAVMHFDYSCDGIVGVGSGVINDIGKLLSRATNRTYLIVATAPSMDGYASPSSSMERDGLKVSLDSAFPWGIVGDLDVLCQAPMKMLRAGVGDMLAKYVSLCEWEIARILVDEYHCPVVAEMVKTALDRVVNASDGLMSRDPEAVKAVMEGMVIAGFAMKYAGVSRPASGVEHYFSHVWDMRSLAFGTGWDIHGIQVGVGTLLSLKLYDYLRTVTPDKEKALEFVADFSLEAYNRQLTEFIGPGAKAMIAAEEKAGKYDPKKHAPRLERIIAHWDEIQSMIAKLPSYAEVYQLMERIGAPVSAEAFGVAPEQVRTACVMTKDIRDKYVASRLLWDLGLLDEVCKILP